MYRFAKLFRSRIGRTSAGPQAELLRLEEQIENVDKKVEGIDNNARKYRDEILTKLDFPENKPRQLDNFVKIRHTN